MRCAGWKPIGLQWMAENERHALILTDANILIDYASSGIDVLRLVSDHLAPVVVLDVVFQEVRELTLDMAESVGVTVLETPLWLMTSGTAVSRPLSFEDQVCLEMASRSGWTCACLLGKQRTSRARCTRRIRIQSQRLFLTAS